MMGRSVYEWIDGLMDGWINKGRDGWTNDESIKDG